MKKEHPEVSINLPELPFLRDLFQNAGLTPKQREAVLAFYERIKDDPRLLEAAQLKFEQSNGTIVAVFQLDNGWIVAFRIFPNGHTEAAFLKNIKGDTPGQLRLPVTVPPDLEGTLRKLEGKPPEPEPTQERRPLSPESRMEKASDYFDRLVKDLREKGFLVKRSSNVAELEITSIEGKADEIPGEYLVPPEEYEKRFGKPMADRLIVAREIYHNAWQEKNSQPRSSAEQIDSNSQDRLQLLQNDLHQVYDQYGGRNSKIPTRQGRTKDWPDSIPTEADLAASRSYPEIYEQLASEREALLKEYTPEALDRLAQARENKINALAEIRVENDALFRKLERDYDIRIDFRELHQARPGNDIMLVDKKTGASISLDDYLKSGFPQKISQ